MADDNTQMCMLIFNIFAFVITLYICQGLYELHYEYNKQWAPEIREICGAYVTWKTAFNCHVMFFFICMTFSVGTA
jgi:hypothetical protein